MHKPRIRNFRWLMIELFSQRSFNLLIIFQVADAEQLKRLFTVKAVENFLHVKISVVLAGSIGTSSNMFEL